MQRLAGGGPGAAAAMPPPPPPLAIDAHARPPLLAFAGDLADPADAPSHYNTRAGGVPVLPGASPPAGAAPAAVRCGACGAALTLVLQARAPRPPIPAAVHPPRRSRRRAPPSAPPAGRGRRRGGWRAHHSLTLPTAPPSHAAAVTRAPEPAGARHRGSGARAVRFRLHSAALRRRPRQLARLPRAAVRRCRYRR